MSVRFSLLLAVMLSAMASAADARRPNVVVFLADDLGYGELGCYGQKKILTPRLDKMASEGLRFTNAYSGNAVCAPSRCSLMTGLHQGHAWVRDNRTYGVEGQTPLPASTVTMAHSFAVMIAFFTTGRVPSG